MSKTLIYLFSILFLPFLLVNELNGQNAYTAVSPEGFKVDIIVGTNFSQLDGDDLDGYKMVGMRTGTQISHAIYPKGGLAIGLLYEQKGSSSELSILSKENQIRTRLHYLSIPVGFYFDSGFRAEIERFRFRVQVGLSISRLFSVSSSHPIYQGLTSDFNSFDLAPAIGATYFISRKSGLNLRFERSITDIFDATPTTNLSALRSYLFSLQYLYRL